MAFYLSFKSVSLLFFFLQGLVFSFLLLKKGLELEKTSSRWMSLFILLCCLYISPWMFGYASWYGLDGYREVLFFLPLQHYFLLGPAIFFYSKTLLNPAFKFSKKDWLHFIPALLYILYALIVFIADVWILDSFYFYSDGLDKDLDPAYQFIGTIYLVIYVSLSIKMYVTYRQKIYDELSFADAVTYKWFKQFLIVLVTILIARILFLAIYPNWGDFGAKFWYYFIFSALFYYIALKSYTNTIALSLPFKLPNDKEPVTETTGRRMNDLEEKKRILQEVMLHRTLYRIPTLTLDDLSTELGLSKEHTSTIINQGFGMNFNDYVNTYRVEEIKKRFREGETSKFTVLGIALDSGFNSKTTFNRAFKKYTGSTPVQYLKKFDKS